MRACGIAVLRYDVGRLRDRVCAKGAMPGRPTTTCGRLGLPPEWLRILLNRVSANDHARLAAAQPIPAFSAKTHYSCCSRNSTELANDIVRQVRARRPLRLSWRNSPGRM